MTEPNSFRIGHGYDVHRFAENRKLYLGGVEIPYNFGLLGHSDADVLIHALMDSMLGAAGLPDIGAFFPDNDEKYKDIRSTLLLAETVKIVDKAGYCLGNADITVFCETPKLRPYIDSMKRSLAEILGTDNVNIKATTEEGLGFTGRKEGIAVHAVSLLVRK